MFSWEYPEFHGIDACVRREDGELWVFEDDSWSVSFFADDVAENAFAVLFVKFLGRSDLVLDDFGNSWSRDQLTVGV
jgi:hypothetical protein